jgi:Resolvase, N terminal domain
VAFPCFLSWLIHEILPPLTAAADPIDTRSYFARPMKRAVIYARFSTDLQNERSIEDQITLCRGYNSREGMNVVEVYEDRARSGGSVMGRGGLLRLLE